ncbi:MAG TPA: hypothetical protein VGH27_01635 [Streptosporangiaceae bacterium]|jgi:hypothetical protein
MATSTDRVRRFRERQRQLLEPADPPPVRDADELLAPAVEETIEALKLRERDAGAAQLARGYAASIDHAKDPAAALRVFGPLLLKSLEALGATPASRAGRAGVKPQAPKGPPSGLSKLRSAHIEVVAKRQRGAP